MTQAIVDVEALRTAVTGAVVAPDGLEYEQARKVWNADIDHHPAVVVQCGTAQDAAEAIRFAQDQGLEVAVRCGAHSMPGYSSVDGGLVIDLGRMNQVTVDPEAKRARVQGGALLRDLDAATQGYGLAVPAGLVSHTCVAGLTLGGGMGWLTTVNESESLPAPPSDLRRRWGWVRRRAPRRVCSTSSTAWTPITVPPSAGVSSRSRRLSATASPTGRSAPVWGSQSARSSPTSAM